MIPLGQEKVTLYHRVTGTDADGRSTLTWRRILLDGCSWRHAARYSLSNAHEVVCRIPAGQTRPVIGDVLVLGAISRPIRTAAELACLVEEMREKPGAFRVAAINDNDRAGFPLPHYAARGQ